ncbi:NUDIX hydrolase [Faecalimonas sp.]
MRLLFELDKKDYDINGTTFERPSVRGIIICDGKIGMVHSVKYDYYKFPGGGIEEGESQTDTLIREVAEESGLRVIPQSTKEYGYVHRIEKGDREGIFIQDNYYYICKTEKETQPQNLDVYEAEESFTLEFIDPYLAINANRCKDHGPKNQTMIEREALVLEKLIEEGYFKNHK